MFRSFYRTALVALATAAAAATAAPAGTATTDRPVFSGQATAVTATVPLLGQTIVLGDTGYFEAPAFAADNCAEQGVNLGTTLTVEASILCGSTNASGNESVSKAHVAELEATVAGIPVSATVLSSDASASCGATGGVLTGDADVADARVGAFVIDADPLLPSPRNEPIVIDPITGAFIVIGERRTTSSGNHSSLTITALRVVVPGVADVSFATAHADVRCQGKPACPSPTFMTSGGWIDGKRHFAVAFRDGDLDWGHMMFTDKANGLTVRGAKPWLASLVYGATGADGEGQLYGNATVTRNRVTDPSPVPFRVRLLDKGEPGRGDFFELELGGTIIAAGPLAGGNIQAHKPCRNVS